MTRLVKLKVQPRLLDQDTDEVLHECSVEVIGEAFSTRWRWLCTCGGKGHWQAHSDASAVFDWFKHAWRKEGMRWPRGSSPAYEWYEKEKAS